MNLRLEVGQQIAPPAGDELHVWSGTLDASSAAIEALACLLTADELERARRYRFARDRRRFVVSRGLLRRLLANYTGIAPAELVFAYSAAGKPSLAHGALGASLTFNLSHAHERMVVAVSYGRQVGIDVEYIRPLDDAAALAARICTPREREALDRLHGPPWLAMFYTYWTCKEAFVKASGVGLSYPVDRVEVALTPSPVLMLAPDAPRGGGGWALLPMQPAAGYVAALVADGPVGTIKRGILDSIRFATRSASGTWVWMPDSEKSRETPGNV